MKEQMYTENIIENKAQIENRENPLFDFDQVDQFERDEEFSDRWMNRRSKEEDGCAYDEIAHD